MRLIDADALSKLVGEPIEAFLRRLDLKLPPTVDAVKVVRCKDCRWYENDGWGYGNCYRRNVDYLRMNENDFCSYGEREEDETD